MLTRNGTSLGSNPSWHGGASVLHVSLSNYIRPGSRRNWYASPATSVAPAVNNGMPSGAEHPAAWMLPRKGGGLAAFNTVRGSGSVTAGLSMGKAMDAALLGSGAISAASLGLVVQMASALAGSGLLSGSLQTVAGMAANLSGSGSMTASLGLIVSVAAALAGSGSVSGNLRGTLSLDADIFVNQSEATVQQIVDAVWNALAADYNTPLTMGNKMNSAGNAGDPWSTALPGSYGPGTAGKIVGDRLDEAVSSAKTLTTGERDAIAIALLDLANAAGTDTLREILRGLRAHLFGQSSGLTNGFGTYLVRDPENTKNVVQATIDANGNRTSVARDLSP
jgi:hypothetical protein